MNQESSELPAYSQVEPSSSPKEIKNLEINPSEIIYLVDIRNNKVL
jgi:hypothetical protein